MKFNKLKLKDKAVFEEFLNLKKFELSAYSFSNIFIWSNLFDIFWVILEDNLCLFFKDRIATFMYLPPLGIKQSDGLINQCFKIMDRLNYNRQASRIENTEEKNLEFYNASGYRADYKSCEYLYESSRIASLNGKDFKIKRWAKNHFVKNNRFSYQPFCLDRDKDRCLDLCRSWINQRKETRGDFVYRYMLDDSLRCQEIALNEYDQLNLVARVVRVNDQIKAYTLGFKLNRDCFCVLFEVCDLSVKGIAQFIFKEFSCEAKSYKYINVMDDSGLESLKKVKSSYRPCKTIPSYIIKRKC